MKRRDFILASSGILVPALARGAQPCPPPQVGVAGGGSASTNCTIVSAGSYSTNFSATENPISDGGKWVNGRVVGLDWNNVQSTLGKAYGSQTVDGYNDCIAHLNTAFAPNQYAQGTVHRASSYSPGVSHEIELLLRFKITPRSARGYEVLWAVTGELAIVRWNGPLSDYTPLFGGTGNVNIGQAVDGDVLRAEITGGVIKVYKNGLLVGSSPADATWIDGQPGIGFWPKPGATLGSYGWKSYQAGSL